MRASSSALLLVLLVAPALALAEDRSFVFTERANGPVDSGEVTGIYAMNVGASTTGALRFVPSTVGQSGVVYQIGAQVALAPWAAIGAFGLAGMGYTSDAANGATGGGYLHFTIVRPDRDTHDGGSLAIQVWAVREFAETLSLSGWVNGSYRLGALDLGANAQLEHRFVRDPADADAVDVLLRLAATYAVAGDDLHLGVEYVGQDLEGYLTGGGDLEAEGGAVHLFALSATSVLADKRLNLGLAPGVVFNARTNQAGFGGRLQVAYRF